MKQAEILDKAKQLAITEINKSWTTDATTLKAMKKAPEHLAIRMLATTFLHEGSKRLLLTLHVYPVKTPVKTREKGYKIKETNQ